MRKAGTIADNQVQISVADANMFISLVDNTANEYSNRKTRLESDLTNYKRQVNQAMRYWTHNYKQLKTLPIPTVSIECKTKAETLARQFARHEFIDNVVVSGHTVVVYTKLLFANIRLSDGSRVHKRRCLGAFKITFAPRGHYKHDTRVDNLLFTTITNPQWGVESGHSHVPCTGEYSPLLQQAQNDGDWYTFVDTYINFLRFAGDDGAYIRSHRWQEQRLGAITSLCGQGRVRTNSTLVMLKEFFTSDGTVVPNGSIHKIVDTNNGYPFIKINDTNYRINDNRAYAVILNKLYKKITNYSDIERMYMAPLDALPDGSTLLQAQELLKI